MSLSAFLKPGYLENYLTGIVADNSGNIIGICKDDFIPVIYFSPNYNANGLSASMSPIDNQIVMGGASPYNVTVVPKLISASADLTKGLIATYGEDNRSIVSNRRLYPFLYRFSGTFSDTGSNYSYTQLPFYDSSGYVMIGYGNGDTPGMISLIRSMAVSPDGTNMYISYTDHTGPGFTQGMLLKYNSNGSYTTSGPDGEGGSGSGEGIFQVSDYADVTNIVCANDNILYYSSIPASNQLHIFRLVDDGLTSFNDITDNLSTGLGASTIRGLACSSDGSILYAIDSTKLYKYNSSGSAGSRWSVIPIPLTPTPSLTEIKCDPTGIYIMLSDTTNNSVYFSDDAGIKWQTDYPPTGNPPYSPLSIACPSEYRQYISYSDGTINIGTGVYERMSTTVNTDSANFLLSKPSPTKMITNTDGSKILFINGTSNLYYSTTFGNTFTEISNSVVSSINFAKIAASKDFSKILVQMENNTLKMVTLLANNYTLTSPEYEYGITRTPSTTLPSLLSVSADGNMAILQDVSDLTNPSIPVFQYNLWYSIQGSVFSYVGPVDFGPVMGSNEIVLTISNSSTPRICVFTADNSTDEYRYAGALFGYGIKSMIPSGSSFTRSIGNGLPSSPNLIASDITGQYIFISPTSNNIYLSSNYGVSFSFLINTELISGDIVLDIACNSTATALIILTNRGVCFTENINPATGFIGAIRFMTAPAPSLKFTSGPITSITSNSNGGRQYFFNSTSGLTSRNSTGSATPCFLEGTKILCKLQNTEIYLSVQNLKVGTLVKTLSGFKKVYKIGSSCIRNPGHSGRTMDRLYVCKKENFPELNEDLFITGYHSILVDELTRGELDKTMKINGQVFEADNKKCLMAGVSNKTEPWAQEGTFTIWHLSLEDEDHDTKFGVYSNGLLTETCSMNYMDHDSIFNFCKRKIHIPTLTGTPTKHTFNKSSLKA